MGPTTGILPGSDSAGVNAILPGMKVDCVIGLCRVLDFGTATEVRKPRFSPWILGFWGVPSHVWSLSDVLFSERTLWIVSMN